MIPCLISWLVHPRIASMGELDCVRVRRLFLFQSGGY